MKHTAPDPVWKAEIYSRGKHLNLYPFDAVVSFLFRWHPRDKVGVGALAFNSRSQVETLFSNGWEILSLQHVNRVDFFPDGTVNHAHWRIVVRKL